MLTWMVVVVLAIGAYGQRLVGMFLIKHDRVGHRTTALLAALPVAIMCAVAAEQTFSTGGELVLDARVAGVGAAIVCAWRRLPLYVTICATAMVTALFRLVT